MSTILLAQSSWTFGINDPSIFAWLILAVIFLSAYLCWRASKPSKASGISGRNRTWVFLTCVLVLLGINKQLDLHQLLLDKIRDFMASTNFNEVSRTLLIATAILPILLTALAWRLIRHFHFGLNRHQVIVFVALVVLLALQVLRFLPGPLAHVLVTHVFSDDEKSLFHLHYIELCELFCFIGIGFVALTSRRALSSGVATELS